MDLGVSGMKVYNEKIKDSIKIPKYFKNNDNLINSLKRYNKN